MLSDNFLITLLGYLLRTFPTLLVCIIGIYVLKTRALPKQPQAYGIAGLVLLIAVAVAGVAFSAYLGSGRMDYASAGFRMLQTGYTVISQLLHSAALVLLVMAICSRDRQQAEKSDTANPYEQPK